MRARMKRQRERLRKEERQDKEWKARLDGRGNGSIVDRTRKRRRKQGGDKSGRGRCRRVR